MTPETQAFLARVRDAEGPAPGVEARVLDAVRAAVSQPTAASARPVLATKVGWKLALWVGGLALAGVALQPVRPVRAPRPVHQAAPQLPPSAASTSRAPSPPQLVAPEPTHRPAPDAASLQAELAFLAEVHASLRHGDAARALRRLETHRTADRQLAAERSAARVLALCAVGRVHDARQLAADFARRYPKAPQRATVEKACAAE